MITSLNNYFRGSTTKASSNDAVGNKYSQSQSSGGFASNYRLTSGSYSSTPQKQVYNFNFSHTKGNNNLPVQPLFFRGTNTGYSFSTKPGTSFAPLFSKGGYSKHDHSNTGGSIAPGNHTKPAFQNGGNYGNNNQFNNLSGGNTGSQLGNQGWNGGNHGNNNQFNNLSGGNTGSLFGNNSNYGNNGSRPSEGQGSYGGRPNGYNGGWNNDSNFTKKAEKAGTKADKPFSRLTDANYERGESGNLPGPREISNAVSAQSGKTQNANGASDLLWSWGQFVDHDITLSNEGTEKGQIAVPKGDQWLDPTGTGQSFIPITGSDSKTNKKGVEQQINGQTPFIDGSQVYGATAEETANLREGTGGRLRLENGFLPTNSDPHLKVDAGDPRAAEQPGLLSLQTLFAREHNRIADKISDRRPSLSDDKIFEKAQKQVRGQLQSITYNEFLPTFIGDKRAASTAYSGNLDKVDGKISNEFATAAFRVGHTLVSENVATKNADGTLTQTSLDEVFFNPEFTKENGLGSVLVGFSEQTAEKADPEIVDSLRNRLFGAPGSPGMDLAALNIERGREHGLPSYNDMREALGFRKINSFNDPIFQNGYGEKLASVYDSPDQIDLWVGGLAENARGQSMLGQTFSKIIRDQFTNLRAADQNFYSNASSGYSQRNINRLNNTTLADVIRRNTDDSFNIDDTPFIATDNTDRYYS